MLHLGGAQRFWLSRARKAYDEACRCEENENFPFRIELVKVLVKFRADQAAMQIAYNLLSTNPLFIPGHNHPVARELDGLARRDLQKQKQQLSMLSLAVGSILTEAGQLVEAERFYTFSLNNAPLP